MTLEEIKQQLDFLSEKIDLINTNIQFNITTFLTVLAISIALSGAALVLLVKNIVNKRINEELKKISDDRDAKIKEATDKIDKRINKIVRSGNGGVHFEDGTHIIYFNSRLFNDGSNTSKVSFPLSFNENSQVIPMVSVLNGGNNKVNIKSVNANGILFDTSNVIGAIDISIIAIGKII